MARERNERSVQHFKHAVSNVASLHCMMIYFICVYVVHIVTYGTNNQQYATSPNFGQNVQVTETWGPEGLIQPSARAKDLRQMA